MNPAVQQIKDRLTIEEVVSWYVVLNSSGRHLKAKSPFAKENTASFFVSPDKGLFYCFSTGKGGDMFTFIQEVEGVDFSGSLKLLADRAGVQLQSYDKKGSDKRSHAKAMLSEVNRWYQVKLRRNTEVISYLVDRGLTKEIMTKFQLGFASGGNSLLEKIKRKNDNVQIAESAGLVATGERGEQYDRFRDRVMFPIWNPQGDVVGFTGRIFMPGRSTDKIAKYLNSPESEFFHKSRLLYGYHLARKAIMDSKQVVLVEGQFDVILSHQAGIAQCVGISGTALSHHQIGLLQRFAQDIILALDSDRAGIAASEKTALEAYRAGMNVKAVVLPDGKDPADVISDSSETWQKMLEKPVSFITYRLTLNDFEEMSTTQKMHKVKNTLLPLIAVMPSAVQKDIACSEIADVLGVSVEAVRRDLKDHESKGGPASTRPNSKVSDNVSVEKIQAPEELLVGMSLWINGITDTSYDWKSIKDELDTLLKETEFYSTWDELLDINAESSDALVFRAELMFGSKPERIVDNIRSLIGAVELRFLQKQFNMTFKALKEHERSESTEELALAQQRAQELGQKIQAVRSRLNTI